MALRTDKNEPSYEVRLDFFEGPLDLLLFLIRQKKINIHDIPIAMITKEYLEYLDKKQHLNLEHEAEFLLMAAILIYIKSQMLLPREKKEGWEEDPRQPLVEKLLDYERIKQISQLLRAKEDLQIKLWTRQDHPISFRRKEEAEIDLEEVSIFDLAEKFFSLLKTQQENLQPFASKRQYSIEDKIQEILTILNQEGFLDFTDYFYRHSSLEEALVGFFSLLELIKRKIVVALQDNLFQTIRVWIIKGKTDGYPA